MVRAEAMGVVYSDAMQSWVADIARAAVELMIDAMKRAL